MRHSSFSTKTITNLFVTFMLFVTIILASSALVHAEEINKNTLVADEFKKVYDPLEPVNRAIYEFNLLADEYLMRPITKSYRFIFPKPVRKGIGNVVSNLQEPITFLNATLQGDVTYAITTLGRFMLNTTFGIGGVFKFVKTTDNRTEDFGQTLGRYGLGSGPYLMLPILGPSNLRDGVGRIADIYSDPLTYALNDEERIAQAVITGIVRYDDVMDLIEEIELTSLDPYAAYRSMYQQYRENQISNGKTK